MSRKDTEKSPLQLFAERQAQRISFLKGFINLPEGALDEILQGAPSIRAQKDKASLEQAKLDGQLARKRFRQRIERKEKKLEEFLPSRPLSDNEQLVIEALDQELQKVYMWQSRNKEFKSTLIGAKEDTQPIRLPRTSWSPLSGELDIPPFLKNEAESTQPVKTLDEPKETNVDGSPWGNEDPWA